MAECKHCKQEIPTGAKFCGFCGAPVGASSNQSDNDFDPDYEIESSESAGSDSSAHKEESVAPVVDKKADRSSENTDDSSSSNLPGPQFDIPAIAKTFGVIFLFLIAVAFFTNKTSNQATTSSSDSTPVQTPATSKNNTPEKTSNTFDPSSAVLIEEPKTFSSDNVVEEPQTAGVDDMTTSVSEEWVNDPVYQSYSQRVRQLICDAAYDQFDIKSNGDVMLTVSILKSGEMIAVGVKRDGTIANERISKAVSDKIFNIKWYTSFPSGLQKYSRLSFPVLLSGQCIENKDSIQGAGSSNSNVVTDTRSSIRGGEIADGKKVSFDYTLTVDNQQVESTHGKKPLEYVQGKAMLIPGLEKKLAGMRVGDSKTITVQPEDGYGSIRSEAVREIEKSKIPRDVNPAVGMVLEMQDPQGNSYPAIVKQVKGRTIILDFNHPLAGKRLTFDVKIVSVEP